MGNPATARNTVGTGRIDMIGVPFDGMGRSPGQAGAAEALRAAGLSAVFGPDAVMEPDLMLPGPVGQRAAGRCPRFETRRRSCGAAPSASVFLRDLRRAVC